MTTADRYVGTRYTWGGEKPATGFDCSGFVQYVFQRNGVSLPRTSRQMSLVGRKLPVRVQSLRRGDLVFFSQRGGRVDHVAIYAGDNRILHSSKSGGGVRYDDLSTARGRWFAERMVGARRVIADGRSLVDALDAALRLAEPLDLPDDAPLP
jgi:cell wall-associated NlpC family hydrolase